VGKNINLVCDELNFVKYCICNVEKGLIENTKRKLQDGQYNNEILCKSEIIKDMVYLRDRNDSSFLEKAEIEHILQYICENKGETLS
jgi:hypothetical protein